MAERFYGPWFLNVVGLNAAFAERVTIRGSGNSDGSFRATRGMIIPASVGDEWTVELEWSRDGGVTWQPSATRRTGDVTRTDGLVVTLAADDDLPERRDNDFNDLVVFLKYFDPTINPTPPSVPDFEIPKEWVKPRRD